VLGSVSGVKSLVGSGCLSRVFCSQVKDKQAMGRRMGKKSKAALLVSKSSYKAAFQLLWSAKGARKPMMDFFSKQLKMEVRTEDKLPL